MGKSIKNELMNGFVINFVAKYSNVLIQFIIGAILARLLTPSEFGVVAVVMVFVNFFNLLSYMGMGPAIIQNKELKDQDLNNIFLGTIIVGCIIATLFYCSAGFVARFFNNDQYIDIIKLLSISVFFFSLSIVPKAQMSKEKRFKQLGIIEVSINTAIGVLTVLMAYKGLSYYSIVYKSIITSILTFIVCKGLTSVSLKKISYNGFKVSIQRIIKFSVFQSFFDIVNYFSRNLDNLLIGRYLGSEMLGSYDIAYKLMMYPITNFTHVLTPVLLPVLKDYQDDYKKIYQYYMKIVRVLSVVGVMASVMLFFTAKEVIRIIYGTQWDNSVGVFKILAISICAQMVLSSSGSIFQILGKTKELFISGTIGALVLALSFTSGILIGSIEAVGMCFLVGTFVNFIQGYYILIKRVFGFSLLKFIKGFKDAAIFAIIMIPLVSLSYFFNVENVILSFIIKCGLGTIGVIVGAVSTGILKDAKNLIRKKEAKVN